MVTGADGFIGSNIVAQFNKAGIEDIVASDRNELLKRPRNLADKTVAKLVSKDRLFASIGNSEVSHFIHLGARTDTTETDSQLIMQDNLAYSKMVWNWCTEHNVRLIYASSASVYGDGRGGFSEDLDLSNIPFQTLSVYAQSKLLFDRWALQQARSPPSWVGFRLFNVYGPAERHKGNMASFVYQAFQQASRYGTVRLFKSSDSRFVDGGQLRDFIYIRDVANILIHTCSLDSLPSGIYNVGTGVARSFNDLVSYVFESLAMRKSVQYVDMPDHIKKFYQNFTQADISRLSQLYGGKFTHLEEGVNDYAKVILRGF